MKKVSKKEIRKVIADAIKKVHVRFKTSLKGEKGEKLLDSFSRKYASEIKKSIKKSVPDSPKGPRRKIVKRRTKKIK
jgi:hypothetical protein